MARAMTRPGGSGHGTASGDPAHQGRGLWRIYIVGGLAAIAAYIALPVGLWQDALYVALSLATLVAIVVGARLHRPPRTAPWLVMAVGQVLWVVADAVGNWQADVLGVDRFPGPADFFYLLGYPVLGCGLFLLVRGRRPRRDVGVGLDSAIVTVGLGLLSWVLLARPTLAQYQGLTPAAAVAVAYPLADIVMMGMLVALLSTPGARTPALRLLLVALVLLIAADDAAAGLGVMTFASSAPINPVWLGSYVAWGAAALHPSMRALSTPTVGAEVVFSRRRLEALAIAVLVAPCTLAVQLAAGIRLDAWAVVVCSIVLFTLVVARMKFAIDQITAANQDREQAQAELAHQADHDSLTGLANRKQAIRLISGALSRAQRSSAIVGLFFVDLDGFKNVNDIFGHAAGDEVLTVVARRMESEVRTGDVVARLGGDEFLVLLEPLIEETSATVVADRLIAAVSAPIALSNGQHVRVGTSIGAALSQDGQTDAEMLMHEADVAVYRAKSAGRGRTEFYDQALRDEIHQRNEIEAGLRVAINTDQLVLHYQPILHLATGEVEGYEALVRWLHPSGLLMLPDQFIPVAERSELICELDSWVLSHATKQLAIWNSDRNSTDLTMAVNVSGRHVARSRIQADVTTALLGSGIKPRQLVLEITETAFVDDLAVVAQLHELRRMGVAISLDDFGTGYNSIARLENLPVDIVKVDKKFLHPGTAPRLLQLIVQSAQAFGLPVVAEGVENEHQLATVCALNCESGQGFLLGRPVDQPILAERLSE